MGWISVKKALPKCPRGKDSPGVLVLVWPRTDIGIAYYGRRVTRPSFYLYGVVLNDITHWQPLPDGPKIRGMK